MMQRGPRFPPPSARLIRLEEGPPMFRMLGYADRSNLMSDLADTKPTGFYGPFSIAWPHDQQSVHVGPGRFGLPSQPLAFTTVYWDDNASGGRKRQMRVPRRPYMRLRRGAGLPTRPEAEAFPEMAVPGTGVLSRFRDSGYTDHTRLDAPFVEGSDRCNCPTRCTGLYE
ncbi:hypothetical protein EGW08_006714 [Elysia chlorotica]|uniref:Uncharacterized protein n=1 Tax=Elysia chlorotica TaxID=188477 RepID=A0A3S1HT02_ELYCH|nr:hypothetical protein EGW08_006714 [Elysia chlorotica]